MTMQIATEDLRHLRDATQAWLKSVDRFKNNWLWGHEIPNTLPFDDMVGDMQRGLYAMDEELKARMMKPEYSFADNFVRGAKWFFEGLHDTKNVDAAFHLAMESGEVEYPAFAYGFCRAWLWHFNRAVSGALELGVSEKAFMPGFPIRFHDDEINLIEQAWRDTISSRYGLGDENE